MNVRFKTFRTATERWEQLFSDAAEFASAIGDQQIINITTSCDQYDSLVTVWYWDK